MPLPDRPDFQEWLERFEARHSLLHDSGPELATSVCDGCGDSIGRPISPTGLCLVCLAETYGRERGQAAGRVAGKLEAALSGYDGTPTDVRDAVEEVLARFEGDGAERDDL